MLNRQIDPRAPELEHTSLIEEPLLYGQNQHGFSMLTLPGALRPSAAHGPVFVFLNGGLLHRVGTNRLYVRLARALAGLGFASLRVDLTGRGDTAMSKRQSYTQMVAADYADIKKLLASRFGNVPVVLVGLCSGADDAIRLAAKDPDVTGMVLFDPVCVKDRGFALRFLLQTISEYLQHPVYHAQLFVRRVKKLLAGQRRINPLDVREAPTPTEICTAVGAIEARSGRVLAVYTRYASRYYNREGQLRAMLGSTRDDSACKEVYWPDVSHTYMLDVHRRRVIAEVVAWAGSLGQPT